MFKRFFLVAINIGVMLLIALRAGNAISFLSPLGRLHPIFVHFCIGLLIFFSFLFLKDRKTFSRNSFLISTTIDLTLFTGLINYYLNFNLTKPTVHAYSAILLYFIFIAIREFRFHIKSINIEYKSIMACTFLVLVLFVAHTGGILHNGSRWWIWQ